MKNLTLLLICVSLLGFSLIAKSDSMNDSQVTDALVKLSQLNIYFGHQSVGQNVVDGIQDILKENSASGFRITDLDEEFSVPEGKGQLLHSPVGENTKPVTKCDDFNQIIRQKLATNIDLAMLKFCYIDIARDTDVEALFEQYRSMIDGLIRDFPEVTFVHITTPLRHSASGAGVWIREILGKPNNSKLDNIRRNEFNQMIRTHYSDSPIFDLAASMSTFENGKPNTFTYKGGQKYPNLIADYTYDGGHLNETGRQKVAADLLKSLSNLVSG